MASASATPAATIQPVRLTPVPGPDHAPGGQRDQQHRQRVIGGERPRCSTGPDTANSAAAKNAARRPNSRPAVPHSSAVAPSMNTSDSTRAPASPPTLSASAPSGG